MTGITLTGPNPAQPFDLQTQQAQLAMAQQLAQQMLAQGIMGQSPAVIHTGGNNPFARDVPNIGGPIAKVVDAYLGSQNLSNIQDQQQALAQAVVQRHNDAINSMATAMEGTPGAQVGDAGTMAAPVAAGSPVGMGELVNQPNMGGTQGSIAAGIRAGELSTDPQVQEIAKSLLASQMTALQGQVLDPAKTAALLRNVTPQSVASMQHTGKFGVPTLPQGATGLQMKPNMVVKPYGSSVEAVNPNAAPGVAGPGTPAAGPIATTAASGGQPQVLAPHTPGNPTDASILLNPQGDMSAIPISAQPGVSATQDVAKGQFDQAAADKDKLLSFQAATPGYVIMAKLAQSAYDQGTMGFAAPQINMVRQFLAATGADPDVANKITNFQTFLKFAVPAATANLKEGVGARPSQLEFNSFLGALGATGETDPRAVMNMIQQRLIDGTNQGIIHNNNLESLGPQTDPVSGAITSPGLPGYSSVAPALKVNFDPASQILTPLSQAGVVASWDQNPTSGLFTNHLIANPATQKPAVPVGGKPRGSRSINYNDLPSADNTAPNP